MIIIYGDEHIVIFMLVVFVCSVYTKATIIVIFLYLYMRFKTSYELSYKRLGMGILPRKWRLIWVGEIDLTGKFLGISIVVTVSCYHSCLILATLAKILFGFSYGYLDQMLYDFGSRLKLGCSWRQEIFVEIWIELCKSDDSEAVFFWDLWFLVN